MCKSAHADLAHAEGARVLVTVVKSVGTRAEWLTAVANVTANTTPPSRN